MHMVSGAPMCHSIYQNAANFATPSFHTVLEDGIKSKDTWPGVTNTPSQVHIVHQKTTCKPAPTPSGAPGGAGSQPVSTNSACTYETITNAKIKKEYLTSMRPTSLTDAKAVCDLEGGVESMEEVVDGGGGW